MNVCNSSILTTQIYPLHFSSATVCMPSQTLLGTSDSQVASTSKFSFSPRPLWMRTSAECNSSEVSPDRRFKHSTTKGRPLPSIRTSISSRPHPCIFKFVTSVPTVVAMDSIIISSTLLRPFLTLNRIRDKMAIVIF